MKRQVASLILVALFGVVCALTCRADDAVTIYRDELACGGSTFHLSSGCLVDPQNHLTECVNQSLALTHDAGGISIPVMLGARFARPPAMRRRVLDGWVTKWACIRSTRGEQFLFLLHSCRGLGDRCAMHGQSAEWTDIVDGNGHRVTGGRNGMEPGLLRRLGLDAPLKVVTAAHAVGPDR
jgi:hypothetical protein